MSQVRMCDTCGTIFAEGEEGSAVGTVTLMVKDPRSGGTRPEQRAQDMCPLCASGVRPAPRVLEAGEAVADRYDRMAKDRVKDRGRR